MARPMGQMFRLIIGMSHVLLIEVLHPVSFVSITHVNLNETADLSKFIAGVQ